MGQIMKDNTRVCQIPPTLITASGKWHQRPWTSILSLSVQTKAASLQLAIAALYLFIGGASSYVTDISDTILFGSDGYYGNFGGGDNALSVFFLVTIMPLLVGAIALILFYGFWMDNRKLWRIAISLNLFGLSTMVPIAGVLDTVLSAYSNPSPSVIWGSLLYLIPLVIILSFTLVVYMGLQLRSLSMAPVQDCESNELQQLLGSRRRRKWNK
ncbi:MAG: hypothetical protein ACFFCP_05035 [Promethearchaeota archaeon]